MKKIILALLISATLFSCKNNGKKIKVEGTNAEVYYKEGVTENEAKNTGAFLKREFIQDNKAASMQVTKEGEVYTLRFVYEKSFYDTLKNADNLFKLMGAKASKEVFGGKKVTIALADEYFKDFKVLPFDEAIAKLLDEPALTPESLGYYDHDEAAGVKFFWKDMTDTESKTIADYIAKNGAFAGGQSEIYMSKENNRYIIKFPMLAEALADPSYISQVDKVSKEIKENVFADQPYSFVVTDQQLKTAKTWDY